MPFIVTSRARHLLVILLNSGDTLHLAPGEASAVLEDYELKDNEGVQKLTGENLITVALPETAQPQASASLKQESVQPAKRNRRAPRKE